MAQVVAAAASAILVVLPLAPSTAVGARGPRAAKAVENPDPLRVTIDRLTPGVIPTKGAVVVTGRIRNTSDQAWTKLSVYPLTSYDPLTTAEELAAAAASDPADEVGSRITDPDIYRAAADLAPGESTRYRLRIPLDQLGISGLPGVYWFGVHVLATDANGDRIDGADGRARTFLPLVPPDNDGVELALGVQFRQRIVRAADGSIEPIDWWNRMLEPGGRLGRLLSFAGTTGAASLTRLVDPAVLDAVQSIAQENPPIDLAPPPGDRPGTGDEVGDGGESGDPGPSADPEPEAEAPQPSPESITASTWLADFVEQARSHPLWALPYGDLDVAAASRTPSSGLLPAAVALSADSLANRSLDSVPVIVPLPGTLPTTAFDQLDPDVPLVLWRSMVTDGSVPVRTRSDGGELLLNDTAATAGGPGPEPALSALALRQRLLAEAALQALSPRRTVPLVALLPPTWDPGQHWRKADFFDGLDVPWLSTIQISQAVSQGRVLAGPLPAVEAETEVRYDEAEENAELPIPTLVASQQLMAAGDTLAQLLTQNPGIASEVDRQALLTSSVFSRFRPFLSAERARDGLEQIRTWLGSIEVRGPSFVTMSSETGTFQVTVVNGLDQPVTVGVESSIPDTTLSLESPDPVQLVPRERVSIPIEATATEIGIHQVTIRPVTASGTSLNDGLTLSIRSSRVGLILWLIMGGGAAVLFSAIAVRLTRRIRNRRRRAQAPAGAAR